MLTVTTTSTSDYLTTLSSMKDMMGVTDTVLDGQWTDNILAAGESVATYVGYWPLRQRYTETVAGYGNLKLLLSATPIRAIASIRIDGQLVDPATYTVDKPLAGLVHRDKGWPWTAGVETDLESHVAPYSELKRFTVDYEAGWVLTTSTSNLDSTLGFITSSGGRTLPRDFEAAVQEQAKSFMLSRKRDSSIIFKRVGSLQVQYAPRSGFAAPQPLCPAAMDLLQNYRRIK
jgi:hypothetical protein